MSKKYCLLNKIIKNVIISIGVPEKPPNFDIFAIGIIIKKQEVEL